ncbi:MAG: hypothetical protein AMXMBFR36_12110 [Acidobacteriota bacterium]
MKRTLLPAVAAAVVLLAGASAALAGGDKCAAQHTQADYQKMADKLAKKGWLGIETEKTAAGYAVSSVAAGSPAERAGFRVGDVLLGINGVRFGEENKEAVAKVKSTLAPGSTVAYTVQRAGAERTVNATLGEVPRDVLAQWLGEHVLEHTAVAVAAR